MSVVALRRAAAAAILLAAASSACAINEMFAKDAPVSKMTEQDFDIARVVMVKALDEGVVGQEYGWSNPATSAAGSITPLASFEKNGLKCRGAAFKITAGGVTGNSQWNLCKTAQGWKVLDGR